MASRFTNFTGDTQAQAQTQDAPTADAAAEAAADRADQVRNALLKDAQENMFGVMAASDNSYSTDLRARSAVLTRYMQREQNSDKASAAYLDPNEYVTALAVGLEPKDASRAILQRNNIPADDTTISDVTDHMNALTHIPYGGGYSLTHSQDPHALTDLFSRDPKASAIIPASAFFAPVLHIEGLTHAQNLDYVNRHEGWHELDTQNKFEPSDKAKLGDWGPNDPMAAVGNPARLEVLTVSNRQESLADVGAAGDMIRNGESPDIIGKITAWRQNASDTLHMTTGALTGLQARIEEMGVDKFRALSDDAARALYNDIADKGAMQPGAQTESIIKYTAGTAADRAAVETAAATDPNARAALDFLKPYKLPPPSDAGTKPNGMTSGPVSPEDKAVADQLATYHPRDALIDRAFADGGKITPATLAKAYGEMQDDLHREIDAAADARLPQAKAVKLQEMFMQTTRYLDYLDVNAQRGVDITKVEPSLRSLAPQTQTPAPVTTPAPDTPAAPDASAAGSSTPATTRARRPTMAM